MNGILLGQLRFAGAADTRKDNKRRPLANLQGRVVRHQLPFIKVNAAPLRLHPNVLKPFAFISQIIRIFVSLHLIEHEGRGLNGAKHVLTADNLALSQFFSQFRVSLLQARHGLLFHIQLIGRAGIDCSLKLCCVQFNLKAVNHGQ